MNTQKHVCVLRLSALGDCINAFGLCGGLLKADPELSLTWVIDSRFCSLFRDDQGRDLVPMSPVDLKNRNAFRVMFELKKTLARTRFDDVLNLQTSLKASILSLGIKGNVKYGYDKIRAREGQALFVNRRVTSPNNPHVLAGFLAFGEAIGYEDLSPKWDFKLSRTEVEPFQTKYQSKRVFLISPASAKASKNWTAEGYAAVAQHALDEGFTVVLTGGNGKTDLDLCGRIESTLAGKCDNLCGKTTLRQLCALTSISAMALSPDSALMHLASALHVPVIGLFAIHNPKRVGSWNFPDLWVSVWQELAKEELGNRHIPWRYRVKTEKAMERISIESVTDMFDRALEQYNL